MVHNVVFIAPHPDDEVLGCGATMNKYSQTGNEVYVLVITRGTPKLYSPEKIANVRKEAMEAHKVLGVKETIFLDFHAPELDITSQAAISREIAAVVEKYRITQMYLPHRGDIHSDHRVVFNAGLVAARPVGGNTVKAVYAYETLSETEWAAPFGDDAFIPTHFVDVTACFEAKLKAFACFKSQIKAFPNPRSIEGLTALASFRGATIGVPRAEAFMTIRTIEKSKIEN
jgi:LmbE family N-acetylglucosaminyl deacetylase